MVQRCRDRVDCRAQCQSGQSGMAERSVNSRQKLALPFGANTSHVANPLPGRRTWSLTGPSYSKYRRTRSTLDSSEAPLVSNTSQLISFASFRR